MSILLPQSGRNGPEKLTLRNDKGGGFGNESEGQQYKQKHNIQRHPGGWKISRWEQITRSNASRKKAL